MLVTEERKIQDSKGFQTSDYWSRSSRRKRAAKKIVEDNNVEVAVGVSKPKEEDYDEAICSAAKSGVITPKWRLWTPPWREKN